MTTEPGWIGHTRKTDNFQLQKYPTRIHQTQNSKNYCQIELSKEPLACLWCDVVGYGWRLASHVQGERNTWFQGRHEASKSHLLERAEPMAVKRTDFLVFPSVSRENRPGGEVVVRRGPGPQPAGDRVTAAAVLHHTAFLDVHHEGGQTLERGRGEKERVAETLNREWQQLPPAHRNCVHKF